MNFLRRPSLPAFLHTAQKGTKRKQSMQDRLNGTLSASATSSNADRVHDHLTTQLATADQLTMTVLEHARLLHADLQRVSFSAAQFAHSLGRLAENQCDLLTTASLYPDGDAPASSAADGDTDNEQFRGLMLAATTHQLAKFYSLMADRCDKSAVTLQEDFTSAVADRHASHKRKTEQWLDEYEKSVAATVDAVERKKRSLARVSPLHPDYRALKDQLTGALADTEQHKRVRMRGMIRAERHHNLYITHRLHSAFRQQLQFSGDVAGEKVELVTDLMADVEPIAGILAQATKPSTVFERLRQASDDSSTSSMDQFSSPLSLRTPGAQSVPYADRKPVSPADSGIDPEERYMRQDAPPSVPDKDESAATTTTVTSADMQDVYGSTAAPEKSAEESRELVQSLVRSKSIAIRLALVLYDYEGVTGNDLAVKQNDEIKVVSVEGEWAYAIKGDILQLDNLELGWVPFGYLAFAR